MRADKPRNKAMTRQCADCRTEIFAYGGRKRCDSCNYQLVTKKRRTREEQRANLRVARPKVT